MVFYRYLSKKFEPNKRKDGLEYASFSSRYMSILFDLLILVLILHFVHSGFFVIAKTFNFYTEIDSKALYKNTFKISLDENEAQHVKDFTREYITSQLVSLIISIFYVIFSWYFFGGTPANLFFGFRVLEEKINKDDNTKLVSKISFLTCIKRLFWIFITFITLFIGFFSSFFNKERKALYDKMAGTIVVKNKSIHKFVELNNLNFSNYIRYDILEKLFYSQIKKIFSYINSKRINS